MDDICVILYTWCYYSYFKYHATLNRLFLANRLICHKTKSESISSIIYNYSLISMNEYDEAKSLH